MHATEPLLREGRRVSASCCASFGELLQGALPGVGPFLVTLPIDLHAHARFSVAPRAQEQELNVLAPAGWKARRLVEALLQRHGLPLRGELSLETAIPAGKGLASSTADLVAAYRAVTAYHGLPTDTDELEALLRDIEPSDGVMHDGVVAYLHRDARLHVSLGPVPPLTLVAVDEGGHVDTILHDSCRAAYSDVEIEEYGELFARLRMALLSRDIVSLGAVATRSAQLNQRLLPKRRLDAVSLVAQEARAAGVVVAHSGTYIGIVIDARAADHDRQVAACFESLLALDLEPQTFRTSQSSLRQAAHD